MVELKGWNHIIYTAIKNNFQDNVFVLNDLYSFEKEFNALYPKNKNIKEKIRQTLQNLRKKPFRIY